MAGSKERGRERAGGREVSIHEINTCITIILFSWYVGLLLSAFPIVFFLSLPYSINFNKVHMNPEKDSYKMSLILQARFILIHCGKL